MSPYCSVAKSRKDKPPCGHWLSLQISSSGKHNAQWTQALKACLVARGSLQSGKSEFLVRPQLPGFVLMDVLGAWTSSVSDLATQFSDSKPYEHVVIHNFFKDSIANALCEEFPTPKSGAAHDWKHYDNPIEQKYSLNNLSELPTTQGVFDALQSAASLQLFSSLTTIKDLEADPLLHGAGLHAYPCRGKLDVHLDYQIHPVTGRERRVNLIVYLNRDWKNEWGGELELWDAARSTCVEKINCGWNTAVLFRTSDLSYHGLPTPLKCPEGQFRKSLAIYYVSPPRAGLQPRPKAQFFPNPMQDVDSKLFRLYEIRKTRLISPEDLTSWPTWREEGGKWW